MNSLATYLLKRIFTTRPAPFSRHGPGTLYFRRFYADQENQGSGLSSDKKSDSSPDGKNDGKESKKLLDVAEYYSQYIKEYEQGDFKEEEEAELELRQETLPISPGRGKLAVLDVEEAVEFLRAERVVNICTLRMPNSLAYAPYMVIGTPLGKRHMNALTEKLLKAYKKKRAAYDPPSLGLKDDKNPDWRAFDLGNLVIHLMTASTRKRYDIEMLWAAGPEHDDLVNDVSELDEYTDRLKKLQEDIEGLSNASDNQRAGAQT